MKKAFLFLMIFSVQVAQAGVIKCEEYSGQFQGTVKSIEAVNSETQLCRIKLSFSGASGNYQRNVECSIDQSALEDIGFISSSCNVKVSQAISGYVKYVPGDVAITQD